MKLRKLIFDDGAKIVKWRNSEHVLCNFLDKRKITIESHNKWFTDEVSTGKVEQFIIVLDNGDEIGTTYLRNIDYTNRKAEFGIFIGEKAALGKGYGTEAVKLTCDYAFNELNLHKVFLRVIQHNKTAIKAYEKNGFREEGVAIDDVWDLSQLHYVNVMFMAKINPNVND